MKLISVWIAALALNSSCPPPAPSPPDVTSPDASAEGGGGIQDADAAPVLVDAKREDVYSRACAALKAAGCREGLHENCAVVLALADERRLVNYHPICVSRATTKAQVRACGKEIACRD